jgi:hypothetical protein
MDELEELVARGIVGNKLNETKDALGIEDKPKQIGPTPKMPKPWSDVVAVYGCITPNYYQDDLQFDPNTYRSAVDCIQKVDGTVMIDRK